MSPDEPPPPGVQGNGKGAYVHTLSLRLTTNQYRRLRRFVAQQEDRSGQRVTHQTVLEMALREFLDRNQQGE